MKKIILGLVLALVLIPSVSLAQSNVDANQRAVMMQLIASLLKQVEVLQARLIEIQSVEKSSNLTPYQKAVKPLVDELTKNRDKQEELQDKFDEMYEDESEEIEEWEDVFDNDCEGTSTKSVVVRHMKVQCSSIGSKIIKLEAIISDIEDDNKDIVEDIEELEEGEEELEEKIDLLKTRYGIS